MTSTGRRLAVVCPAGGLAVADGKQDAWIELPTAAVPVPEQPAPIVWLQAAAPGATAVSRSPRRRT